MKEILKIAGVAAGVFLALAAVGAGFFLRDFDRFADDVYPWGKDGSTWKGDDDEK